MLLKKNDTPKVLELATRISQGPQVSYRNIKSLIRQSLQNDLTEQLAQEREYFVAAAKTRDFATGVTAFVSKKKPEFMGN